ncbi:hypothetical protein KUL49_30100 [Alteromonas sp. KUL49]|nr:hypothetical protein KUL49_30100 [Alteromonas sp. KUL49]
MLNDYTNLELVSTIATMETFQKIYRPEIYNANTAAGRCYRPRLEHKDHSITQVRYDRDERSSLAIEQGRYVDQHFITPHKALLAEWSNQVSL